MATGSSNEYKEFLGGIGWYVNGSVINLPKTVYAIDAGGVAPKSIKNQANTRIQCPLIAKKRGYSGLL